MVYEKVLSLVAEQCAVDEDELNEEVTFKDINADELDVEELVLAAEGEFDIDIDDNDISQDMSIGDFVTVIEQLVSQTNDENNDEEEM